MALRIEFIVKIYKEMKKVQPDNICNIELREMVNNIRKYLRGGEKVEYDTNQVAISMKQLFRMFIIK